VRQRRRWPAARVVVRRRSLADEYADLDLARLGVDHHALDQLADDRALLVAVHRLHGAP